MASSLRKISAAELSQLMKKGFVEIVDVREPMEFQSEKIQGSKNIPLSSIGKHLDQLSKERPGYLLCRSGNRACQAAEKLMVLGYENLIVIEGGLEACKEQGVRISKGISKVWALDRQVRFSAGALVLMGILGSKLLHPGWIGISAFVGAGLVFSGITDTCAMGMLLAKMPWNQTQKSSCSIKKNK